MPPQAAGTTIPGGKHLLDLAGYEGIRVVDAGTALAEFADHQQADYLFAGKRREAPTIKNSSKMSLKGV